MLVEWNAVRRDDADAAVGALLDSLRPDRVRLFMTTSTSVNGERLLQRFAACEAQVSVAAYQPDRFVHARLIGVIAARRAWLLSGSANPSERMTATRRKIPRSG